MPEPQMEELDQEECRERLRALPLYPWAPGRRTRYVRVRPLDMSGRRITVPEDLPYTWWA